MLIVLSTRAAVLNPTRRDCISLRDKHFEQFRSLYLDVAQRADSTGHYRLRTVTPTPFVSGGYVFFCIRAFRRISSDLRKSNGHIYVACNVITVSRVWNVMRLTRTKNEAMEEKNWRTSLISYHLDKVPL